MGRLNNDVMWTLREMRRLYLLAADGLSDSDMALILRIPRTTVWRYRQKLHVVQVSRGKYTAVALPDEIVFAEAVLWRRDYEDKRNAAD